MWISFFYFKNELIKKGKSNQMNSEGDQWLMDGWRQPHISIRKWFHTEHQRHQQKLCPCPSNQDGQAGVSWQVTAAKKKGGLLPTQ